jgi:protein associated with RNAse G/E
MITVIKRNAAGKEQTRYTGEVIERGVDSVVIEAYWTRAAKDLGYTRFEPGDRFIEYYFSNRWFNIFAISGKDGNRKGWYCNVAAPAVISADCIEQNDLLLDVWVDPTGRPLVLDEDEFKADTTLTDEQREGARQGLRDLLGMIAQRKDMFSEATG